MASTRTVREVCAPVASRLSTCRVAVLRCGAWVRRRADHADDAAQAHEDPDDEVTGPTGTPLTLEHLVASGRFVRDSHLGGMFHRGHVSLREDSPRGSLHVSLGEGNRVSVHVDRFSPLVEQGRRKPGSHYSVMRVIVHNVGIVADYARLLASRRSGEQRCELECEMIEVVDTDTGEASELLVCDTDEGSSDTAEGPAASTGLR